MKTFLVALVFSSALTAVAAVRGEAKLTDGQVAKVLLTINEGEIEAAKAAETKSRNDDVRNFAAKMTAEHKENSMTGQKLAEDNKLELDDSSLSKSLKAEAKAQNQKTENAGAAFDKSYIAGQVKMHEKALHIIDRMLLPNAKNGDLHSLLQATRIGVAEHLQQAKKLQRAFH
jgi:putative membrane protein